MMFFKKSSFLLTFVFALLGVVSVNTTQLFPFVYSATQAPSQQKRTIIFFDIGGVLLRASRWKSFQHLGKTPLYYLFAGHFPAAGAIQNKLFAYLDRCSLMPRTTATHGGGALPWVLGEWLAGRCTAKYILAQLDNLDYTSSAEKQMILTTAQLFLPENLVDIQVPIQPMVRLMQHYCHQLGYGNVCILSNWDAQSAPLLTKRFNQEIFNYIPETCRFFSGNLKCNKPDPLIFRTIEKQLGMSNANRHAFRLILIDDEAANCATAANRGWETIHHISPRKTAAQLASLLSPQEV